MVPDQSALASLSWLVVTLSKNTNIQKRLEILRFGGREGIGLSLSFSSSSCVRLARDLEHGLSASLLFIITTLSLRKRKGVIIWGALSAFFYSFFSFLLLFPMSASASVSQKQKLQYSGDKNSKI